MVGVVLYKESHTAVPAGWMARVHRGRTRTYVIRCYVNKLYPSIFLYPAFRTPHGDTPRDATFYIIVNRIAFCVLTFVTLGA